MHCPSLDHNYRPTAHINISQYLYSVQQQQQLNLTAIFQTIRVSRYHGVFIMDFIGANDDLVVVTTGAIRRAKR